MEAKRNISRNWLIAAVVVGTMMLCVGCAKKEGKVLARDDFDGEFTLDWQILNPNPTHFSLTKNPGTLTITTQEGGFHGSATGYKNLFLIDCPAQPGEDFQITTHISSFKPVGPWNQAGLVCWQDEDNYLKWVYEQAPNDSVFTLLSETAAQSIRQVFSAPAELDSLWLRINKRRNFYTVSTSLDGQSFVSRQTRRWGDGTVQRIGLVAKNGSNTAAPEVDAAFGFFAVRTVPAETPAEEAAKYVIPQENLEIAEEMKTCGQNLKKMYAAIKKYEKDKGELPNWLSDLVPDYFSKELLLCPSDPSRTRAVYPDPKLPCGYTYEFCPAQVSVAGGRMSCRDWKTQQVEFFGDIVPVVRCLHHGSMSVNVSIAGHVYSSPETWETIFMPGYTRGVEFPEQQRRRLQLAGRLMITGVVRDEAGQAVDGVKLTVVPTSYRDGTSDAEGKFEVVWDPRGGGYERMVHHLIARHEQRNLAASVEINEDTETLDIKLSPGLIIAGKVVDPNDKAIPDAKIGPIWRTDRYAIQFGRDTVQPDADGNFEIKALPPGHKYSVSVSADGYGRKSVQADAEYAVDNRLELKPIVLALANLSVSGMVVDTEGKPIAGVRVYAFGEGQSYRSVQTDAEGKFTIEKVIAGSIRLRAGFDGSAQTEGGAKDVKIVMGRRPTTVSPPVPSIPKQPPSLVGKPLPELKDLKIELSPADANDKMILVCFWDMEQRPSRYCIRQLAEKAKDLAEKGITIVAVQASRVDRNNLNEWVQKYNVSFPVGMIEGDVEKAKFTWGVKGLPWLILTDHEHIVRANGFSLAELDEKIKEAENAKR